MTTTEKASSQSHFIDLCNMLGEPTPVKAVVDVNRGIMAVGGELHADDEAGIADDGSRQADLWGINLYPADHGQPDWLEFDSMINVRPTAGNRTRSVEDPMVRERIITIIEGLVVR